MLYFHFIMFRGSYHSLMFKVSSSVDEIIELKNFSLRDYHAIFDSTCERYKYFSDILENYFSTFGVETTLIAIARSFCLRFDSGTADYFRQYCLLTFRDRELFLKNLSKILKS